MPLEQQVCSLELSKELKELGYPQESLFWYSPYVEIGGSGRPSFKLEYRTGVKSNREISISAPTVAELGIVLPNGYYSYRREYNDWWCIAVEEDGCESCIRSYETFFDDTISDTEADARAKMLIYLLKNKLITL